MGGKEDKKKVGRKNYFTILQVRDMRSCTIREPRLQVWTWKHAM